MNNDARNPPKAASPSGFLPSLKEFNIDLAKYKHYGTLMTMLQLDKIMDHEPKHQKKMPSGSSSALSEAHPLTSPLESPVDLALKTPEGYSETALTQMIQLRIEQEKTRQTQYKIELGKVVADLLRDAELRGVGSAELIRRLFLEDDTEFKPLITRLRSRLLLSGSLVTHRRKPSDPQPRAATTSTTAVCTPSPNKLPATEQRSLHPPYSRQLKPLVEATREADGRSSVASRASPTLPVLGQPVYPVFYTPNGVAQKSDDEGLPYNSNQNPGMQTSPQAPPVAQPPWPVNQQVPNAQHYYYVNSLPPGVQSAPMMPSQYYIPPPQGMIPWGMAPVPERKRDAEETSHVHKKPRGGKSNINFMITTPKNPPARKYNKL